MEMSEIPAVMKEVADLETKRMERNSLIDQIRELSDARGKLETEVESSRKELIRLDLDKKSLEIAQNEDIKAKLADISAKELELKDRADELDTVLRASVALGADLEQRREVLDADTEFLNERQANHSKREQEHALREQEHARNSAELREASEFLIGKAKAVSGRESAQIEKDRLHVESVSILKAEREKFESEKGNVTERMQAADQRNSEADGRISDANQRFIDAKMVEDLNAQREKEMAAERTALDASKVAQQKAADDLELQKAESDAKSKELERRERMIALREQEQKNAS